jgi:hypothetical protein
MKTITQYREDVKYLTTKIGDMKATCIAENRDPLPEEIEHMNALMTDIEELGRIISAMEREEKINARLSEPQKAVTRENTIKDPQKEVREKDRFNSLGEQLAAVVVAGKPGGKIDPRLYNQTGLNETTPSEGGLRAYA